MSGAPSAAADFTIDRSVDDSEIELVLLPGSLCDERLYEPLLTTLAETNPGLKTTVADLHGLTSIEAMADMTLLQAPPTFALLGLSLGGIVAAELAGRNQERVSGVALFNTSLAEPDAGQLESRRRWQSTARTGAFPSIVEQAVRSMHNHASSTDDLAATMALDAGPTIFIEQNTALLRRRDRSRDLVDFPGPILIATGSQDRLCPPSIHQDLAARLPGSSFCEIGQAGHLSVLDQPSKAAKVVSRWLTSINNNNKGRRNP